MSDSPALPGPSMLRAAAPPAASSPTADLLYDAFYGGALGGTAIAFFFLILDAFEGRPFFTPSLIGSALFTGVDPSTVTEVRLDMVAYYTIVHFAVFGALGATVSRLCSWSGLVQRHPSVVAVVVFAVLTAAIYAGDWTLMPGVVAAVGTARILGANALTGWAMSYFITKAHGEA